MPLPYFYKETIDSANCIIILNEDTSKHIVQVLRMKIGEQLQLTDGKGKIFLCEITNDHRKKCEVTIIKTSDIPYPESKISIAISPIKNTNRFEWFLEKVTEIGVSEIIPLICERTEKPQLKMERLQGILVSAMLQSQQAWLPVLREAQKFNEYINLANADTSLQKLIAHCEEDIKTPLSKIETSGNTTILIGPEGDFTTTEIEFALQSRFEPVSLGETRLRTETAGMVAAVLLQNK